jgi:glycerol-3-phosphate acyltransferase PlsY
MNNLWFIVLGYLSGSILFAYYLPLWWKGIDVTEGTTDGNPGAFNCIAKAGKPIGLLALALDLLKGAAPVFWAAHVLDMGQWTFALVIAAPVLGHAFSLFRHFRGGKAIAVTFGVTIGLWPLWQPFALLAASYLFFSLVVQVEPHRFRSIFTFVCFGLGGLLWYGDTSVALGCLISAGVVILRHCSAQEQEEKPTVRLLPVLLRER